MNGRRAFLQGLVSLPLIGGSVTLVGQPSAVAEPVTLNTMTAYKTWLQQELRWLSWEMADHPQISSFYGGDRHERTRALERTVVYVGTGDIAKFHGALGFEAPSTRAALVLSAVGADWRENRHRG